MTPSIHDSLLYAYEVDGDNRRIVLHTRPHAGGGTAHIDVIFTDVQAYHFEGDCLGNIVFGIKEVSTSSAIGGEHVLCERNHQFGWPRGWDSDTETFDEFVTRNSSRIYRISSSYGMAGFVVAGNMEYLELEEPNEQDQ